jgi:hypothetical protein
VIRVTVSVDSDTARYDAVADVEFPTPPFAFGQTPPDPPIVHWRHVLQGGNHFVPVADWNGPELAELDTRAIEAACDDFWTERFGGDDNG